MPSPMNESLRKHDVRAHRRAEKPDGQRRDEGALHERVVKRRRRTHRALICVSPDGWRARRAARDRGAGVRACACARGSPRRRRPRRLRAACRARGRGGRARAAGRTILRRDRDRASSIEHRHPPATNSRTTCRSASSVAGVDAGRRLVEQQQLAAPARSRARRRRAAAGRRRDARCGASRRSLMFTASSARCTTSRSCAPKPLPEMQPRETPHRHDVPHGCGKRPIHRFDLRHVGDRARRQSVAAAMPSTPARRWSASSRPAMVLSSVDFPEPLGPTMPSASPKCTASVACSSAVKSRSARQIARSSAPPLADRDHFSARDDDVGVVRAASPCRSRRAGRCRPSRRRDSRRP